MLIGAGERRRGCGIGWRRRSVSERERAFLRLVQSVSASRIRAAWAVVGATAQHVEWKWPDA